MGKQLWSEDIFKTLMDELGIILRLLKQDSFYTFYSFMGGYCIKMLLLFGCMAMTNLARARKL